jgi:hypothetical protein
LPKYKIYWKYSLSFFTRSTDSQNKTSSSNSSDDEDENVSAIVDTQPVVIKISDELDNSLNSSGSQTALIAESNVKQTKRNTSQQQSSLIDFERSQRGLINGEIESQNSPTSSNELANAVGPNDTAKKSSPAKLKLKKKTSSGSSISSPDQTERDNSAILGRNMPKTPIVVHHSLKQMMRNVYDTYPELVMPGNILYIYRIKTFSSQSVVCSKLCGTCCLKLCKNKKYEIHYDSRWAHQDEFKKIVLTNRMLMDHFPNNLTDALTYFSQTDRYLL